MIPGYAELSRLSFIECELDANLRLEKKPEALTSGLSFMVGLTDLNQRPRTERSTKLSHNPLQEKNPSSLAVKTNGQLLQS